MNLFKCQIRNIKPAETRKNAKQKTTRLILPRSLFIGDILQRYVIKRPNIDGGGGPSSYTTVLCTTRTFFQHAEEKTTPEEEEDQSSPDKNKDTHTFAHSSGYNSCRGGRK